MDFIQVVTAAVRIGDYFRHCAVMRVVIQNQVEFVMSAVFGQGRKLPLDRREGRAGAWFGG